jgi:GGDEF domain-containing protein
MAEMIETEAEPTDKRLQRLITALYAAQDSAAAPAIFPQDAFAAMLNAAVEKGTINAQQAGLLNDYLAASLAPEKTTGYMDRHTDPLVRACVEHYSNEHPEQPIYRIEGDYMNLGGLNPAVEAASGKLKYREDADKVLRIMAQMLRKEMRGLGKVCAVRHGGDEISLYLVPNAGVDEAQIRAAIQSAQKAMQGFAMEAGISGIPHPKKDPITGIQKPPGVGLGVGLVDIRGKTKVEQSLAIEEGIGQSKKDFYEALRAAEKKNAAQRAPSSLKEILSDKKYQRFLHQAAAIATVDWGAGTEQQKPHEAEADRLTAALKELKELKPASCELVHMAVTFAEKRDHVTDLPMFSAMQQQQVPNFKERFGTKARLVHFDYNNLGGANILGSWVGDAVSRVFAKCIREGMKKQGLDAYIPYLASQGGGKFALLLPETVSKEEVIKLSNAIDERFAIHSELGLELADDEVAATRPIMAEIAAARMKERQLESDTLVGRAVQMGEGSCIKFEPQTISIAEIDNLKSRRKGCRLVTTGTDIDLAKQSVTEVTKKLGDRAQTGQVVVAGFEGRLSRARHPTTRFIGNVKVDDDYKAVRVREALAKKASGEKQTWETKIAEEEEGKTRSK